MNATGQKGEVFKLKEAAAEALSTLVTHAASVLHEPLDGNEKLVADIYTGRDPSGGSQTIIIGEQGISVQVLQDALSTSSWRPPQTTANLFQSRLTQIVSGMTPGVPSFRAKARVAGAAHLAEDQNILMRVMTDHGDLRQCMRRAAFLGMVSPHFGVKVTYDLKNPVAYERPKYRCVEARDCGYEPFHRRFTWHAYDIPYGDMPKQWRLRVESGEEPNGWDVWRVTEVYHDGFRHGAEELEGSKNKCPMSIFVAPAERHKPSVEEPESATNKGFKVGAYVVTTLIPSCPLVITRFKEPAPSEDVSAAEVVSWIPLMRMIVQTLVQIDREIRTSNKTVLYDKSAISPEAIQAVQNVVSGGTTYVPVDSDDALRGVNATMRPVEQNSVLNEYLQALSTYLSLFDDVTGVSPADRGVPANPRKSATEAQAITEASSRRTADRLESMALLWTRIAQIGFQWQRRVFGTHLDIPLADGLVRTIKVPDPVVAMFSFDVDPVELGHLSNAGDIQALMQWHTITTNTQTQFPTGMPRMVRETLRQLGIAMGITDVNIYLKIPTIEVGPEERVIEHLQTQEPIVVLEDDQHDLFIAYYGRMHSKALQTGGQEVTLVALINAIEQHKLYAARRSEVINRNGVPDVIPGVGVGEGEVDNNIASALATGGIPDAVPQQQQVQL